MTTDWNRSVGATDSRSRDADHDFDISGRRGACVNGTGAARCLSKVPALIVPPVLAAPGACCRPRSRRQRRGAGPVRRWPVTRRPVVRRAHDDGVVVAAAVTIIGIAPVRAAIVSGADANRRRARTATAGTPAQDQAGHYDGRACEYGDCRPGHGSSSVSSSGKSHRSKAMSVPTGSAMTARSLSRISGSGASNILPP